MEQQQCYVFYLCHVIVSIIYLRFRFIHIAMFFAKANAQKPYKVFNLAFGFVAWLRLNIYLNIYLKTNLLFSTLFLKVTFAVQYEMNLDEFHIIMDVSRPVVFLLLNTKYKRKFIKRSDIYGHEASPMSS